MNKKILILGASSDMGLALLNRLDLSNFTIGAHCYKGKKRIVNFIKNKNNNTNFKIMKKNLENQKASHFLVDEFIRWSGGIDILVQLNGNVSSVISWEKLREKDWEKDIAINLGAPFFVAQKVFNHMKKNGYDKCMPDTNSSVETDDEWLNLTSGYIKRAEHIFPKQGKKSPWRNNQNFLKDIFNNLV